MLLSQKMMGDHPLFWSNMLQKILKETLYRKLKRLFQEFNKKASKAQ